MRPPELLSGFVQNAALLLIVALIFDLQTRNPASPVTPRGRLLLGLLIGAASIFTMLFAVHPQPDITLDARGLVLAISGLFFGTGPTAVGAGIAILYRGLVIGGPIAPVGITFIVGSSLIGLAARSIRRDQLTTLHWLELTVLGALVAALQILLTWTILPPDGLGILWQLAPTLLVVSMTAMLAMGLLLMDRTRRAQTLRALAEREASFRALTEQLPVIVYRAALDAQSSTLYVSPAVRALGYAPQEWLERTDLFVNSLHPDDRERVLAQLAADREAGRPSDLMYRFRHRNGEWRTMHDRADIVRDAKGTPLFLQGVMVDVTDQQKAAAEQALLAAALDAAVDAIAITDRDGNFIYTNPAFTALTRYRREEAIGRNPRELIKSNKQPRAFYTEMWETLLSGRVWAGRLINRRKDGTEYTEEQAITPVRDAQGNITHFVAIKRDITERLMLEAQANQAQRIESIGRLAGGVAHDFNNLLTVITGTVELAEATAPQVPKMQQELRVIRDAAERGAKLTRQLLAFSRQQVLHEERLDLNDVVRDLHSMLARVIGEQVRIELALSAKPSYLRADSAQLGQVLLNLIVNARDAMPEGGRITVRTETRTFSEDDRRPHVALSAGRYVLLTVQDTGSGMDSATRDRIFEPFFTTKPQGRGTGLGLPMAYGIVKQHGGSIWVESAPGKGSTFTVAFPALTPEEASSADPPSASARRSSGPQLAEEGDSAAPPSTILVVEDEEAIRRVAVRVLATRGHQVLEAESGEQALRVAEGQHLDLLVTDMVMPGMTGPQLASALRERQPDLRVLFTSGYSRDAVAHEFGLTDGYFIPKPYGLRELVAAVAEVLRNAKRDE